MSTGGSLLSINGPDPGQETEKHLKAVHNGANWFYWIAGLSLVNSVVQMFGTEWGFVVGLGITQVFDGIAAAIAKDFPSAGVVVRGFAFLLDLGVAGLFALLARLATRRKGWAFVVGIVLYSLDAALFLAVGGWMGLAFHGLALFAIVGGYVALRKLRTMEIQAGLRPISPAA